MDIKEARDWKDELEKKVSTLLKEYELHTELEPNSIEFIRRSEFDSLGRETGFNYIVEVKVCL